MMNTFMNGLIDATNLKTTENGALAHKTTKSAVYDMFAFGGAYLGAEKAIDGREVVVRFDDDSDDSEEDESK